MDPNTFPTKGNLILAKNSLKLAHMGYELMDKKRNILIRELMGLIDEAKDIQRQIDVTFREAYAALQIANMEIGITNVQTVSYTVPVEESIRIKGEIGGMAVEIAGKVIEREISEEDHAKLIDEFIENVGEAS